MSSLLTGHGHRSSSDRLLNNYLSSQKQLSTALLTLLSHSHSSSSSLLAYVTSSPGVPYNVRRAVQHANFEGPIANSYHQDGYDADDAESNASTKWNLYIASLEHFRKELKEVHLLEEELSQVKRDREILVTRLIKATKSRPTKADLAKAASANGENMSSRMSSASSVYSFNSEGSERTAGGHHKINSKLQEAQAEVLGCEEHLRGLEIQLEGERNKVMKHGLMERFRAMEEVGRMWQKQARLGLAEIERGDAPVDGYLHSNAFEVDSNGSLAPSQSASQVGYQEPEPSSPLKQSSRRDHAIRNGVIGGSVTGSIAEEDEEGSSEDEATAGGRGNYVVHENHPPALGHPVAGGAKPRAASTEPGSGGRPFAGQGIPSITAMKPPTARHGSGSSTSSVGHARAPRRRTQSELGYNPPSKKASIRRNHSLRRTNSIGAHSDGSSVRSTKKKGGFFKSLAKLFKSSPNNNRPNNNRPNNNRRRGGADSPPLYNRSSAGWHTRTDHNLKASAAHARDQGGDSSSEDEGHGRNLVAVSNQGNGSWSVDKVGIVPNAPGGKRVSRSDVGAGLKGRTNSASTITPASTTGTSKKNTGSVGRSGTLKSTTSKRTRQGSITRVAGSGATNATTGVAPGVNGVSVKPVAKRPTSVSGKSVRSTKSNATITGPATSTQPPAPKMPEVPKAPKSNVNPQMFTVTAPPRVTDSLLVSPPPLPKSQSVGGQASSVSGHTAKGKSTTNGHAHAINGSKSTPATGGLDSLALGTPIAGGGHGQEDSPPSVTTPLPPSKTLSPPLKSSLRPTSPMPAFIVSAPPAVVQDKPVEEVNESRDSDSVYESAYEDANDQTADDDEGSEISDMTSLDASKYQVVENTRKPPAEVAKAVAEQPSASAPAAAPTTSATEPAAATSAVAEDGEGSETETETPATTKHVPAPIAVDAPVPAAPASTATATTEVIGPDGRRLERRKSVRMNVPDSPSLTDSPTVPNSSQPNGGTTHETPEWKTRIGQELESSDDESGAYAKAKRSLSRSSAKLSGLGSPTKGKKGEEAKKPKKGKKSAKRNVLAV